MKLLDILQRELKVFPKGTLYAVQDDDGEVKFGKHSHPTLCESGIWQRREDGVYPNIGSLELAEDWDSAIVTKDMWDCHKDAKQGHPHAHLMAQYAEDAKTTDKPWELWQVKVVRGDWRDLTYSPSFATHLRYRRKPKTHIVHGVEVPDLRFKPKNGEDYWFPDPSGTDLVYRSVRRLWSSTDNHRLENNLCYEHTEEGKQAAILHAKSMLGIHPE